MSFFSPSFFTRSLLFGAASLALLAAVPARAQEAGSTSYVEDSSGIPERVVVTMVPNKRSAIGAPIELRSISRAVRFDDLDLTTHAGRRELRMRVRETARNLCDDPNLYFTLRTAGSPPCYRTAVANAMMQVKAAITKADHG
ncbi:MAG: UrcA family protein [Rhizomicrobium sp.]